MELILSHTEPKLVYGTAGRSSGVFCRSIAGYEREESARQRYGRTDRKLFLNRSSQFLLQKMKLWVPLVSSRSSKQNTVDENEGIFLRTGTDEEGTVFIYFHAGLLAPWGATTNLRNCTKPKSVNNTFSTVHHYLSYGLLDIQVVSLLHCTEGRALTS